MVYGFLPNKKQTTYKKFFNMIKKSMLVLNVSNTCETFNFDLEKAAMNAAHQVFKCEICGCLGDYWGLWIFLNLSGAMIIID